METEKKVISYNLESEVIEKICDLADVHGRSCSQMANELLKLSLGMPSLLSIATLTGDDE